MNPTLKLLLASVALSSFALGGCAADSASASDDAAGVSQDVVAQDVVASRVALFAGSFAWRAADSGDFVDFQQLSLNPDGTYTAKIDATLINPSIKCIAFPCLLADAGTWSVPSLGGQLKLKLDSSNEALSTRSYFALVGEGRVLTLTRSGHATKLFPDGNSCANVRCARGTHCEMSSDAAPAAACLKD